MLKDFKLRGLKDKHEAAEEELQIEEAEKDVKVKVGKKLTTKNKS